MYLYPYSSNSASVTTTYSSTYRTKRFVTSSVIIADTSLYQCVRSCSTSLFMLAHSMLLHSLRGLTAETKTAAVMQQQLKSKERRLIVSVKIFGIKGVGGIISIVLPIVMWAVDRFWQKESVSKI